MTVMCRHYSLHELYTYINESKTVNNQPARLLFWHYAQDCRENSRIITH